MAQLTCPSCGHEVAAGEQLCPNCIEPIPNAWSDGDTDKTQVVTAEWLAPPVGQIPAPTTSPTKGESAWGPDIGQCTDPDCPHGGRVPARRCSSCGRREPAPALVRFRKTGESAIIQTETIRAGETLRVGRVNSPLAGPLVPFGDVSREHAVIENHNGILMITDMDSTHGTFVNGTKIPPTEQRALRHGDGVRFAWNLEAEVDLGDSPC